MTANNLKIDKDRVYAKIRTTFETIEGMIYQNSDNRVLDSLNVSSGDFIPVTDVSVFLPPEKKPLFETDIMAINKSHIVYIVQQKRIPFTVDVTVKPKKF